MGLRISICFNIAYFLSFQSCKIENDDDREFMTTYLQMLPLAVEWFLNYSDFKPNGKLSILTYPFTKSDDMILPTILMLNNFLSLVA